MNSELVSICHGLNLLSKCSCCGGTVCHRKCDSCGKDYSLILEGLLNRLNTILKNTEINFEIFIELLNIRHLGESFIEETINKNESRIRNFIADDMQNNNFNTLVKLLSKNNCDSLLDSSFFVNLLAIMHLGGNLSNLDDDNYVLFIEMFVKNILKNSQIKNLIGKYPTIKIVSQDVFLFNSPEKTCGFVYYLPNDNILVFNRDIFLKQKSSNPIANVITIYHELQHIIQRNYYKVPESYTYEGLLMAKDEVICLIIKNYYRQNYAILPCEADANYRAYTTIANDLELLGMNNDFYLEQIPTYQRLCFNERRILDKKTLSINELFEMILDRVDISKILTDFPIIGLEYTISNGTLIKKSKEEIEMSLQNETNPNVIFIYKQILNSYGTLQPKRT